MRIPGILGVAFLAFKAICAGPHWSRGGVPYGKNITVRTIATIGTVYVPYEITSASPGTISPHLEHTSLVSPLNTTKTIYETHNTPLKSPFSKKSWYGYNTTTVGSMSGTGPSYGTCSTYVTSYRSLSGYTTTSTFVSGTRPSYGTYGTNVTPHKTSPRHNSTSSIGSGTRPGYGTHGIYTTPYKTSPRHNSTSSIGSGTKPSYGTHGTCVTPYKTSPRHNSTSNIVGSTRPSYGTHSSYATPSKGSPSYNNASSSPFLTATPSHGTFVSSNFTSTKTSTSYESVKITIRTSHGTSIGIPNVTTIITTVYKSTPSRGFSSSFVNVTKSIMPTTVFLTSTSLVSTFPRSISTPRPSSSMVSIIYTTAFTIPLVTITTLSSTRSNEVISTTSTSVIPIPPPIISSSLVITAIITTVYKSTPSRGFSSSFVNVTKSITATTASPSIIFTPQPSSPPVSIITTILVTIHSVTPVTLPYTRSNEVISTTSTSMILIPPPNISSSSVVTTIISTTPFVSSTPTVVPPPPSNSTGTVSNSQTLLTTSPPPPTETQPSATISTPHTSGVSIVIIGSPSSPSNTVGPPSLPHTETPGTTTESTRFLSKIASTPPLASPTSLIVSVPSPLITTISPSPTSPSISAPLSQPSPITTPASISTSQCCFVVQDTVDYNYWTDISTSTAYYTTVLTSIITHVSSYVDTAVTSVQTSYLPYTNSELIRYNNAEQPLQNTNNAPGGPTTLSSGLGGTATVTYAQTINSPDPFFLYRTAKIILVPAVTEPNGQLACVTTSTFYPSTFNPSIPGSVLFTGINSNAQEYYSSAIATKSATVAAEISLSTPFVLPLGSVPADYTTLTLPTPAVSNFINTKRKMARAITTSSSLALNSSVSEYGYVPNFFISFLAQDPNYVAQYPELASCFPGGPSIDPGFKTSALVQGPTLIGNLVSSATSVAHPSGCFDPNSPKCLTAANSPSSSIPAVAVNAPPSGPSIPPPSPPSSPQPSPPSSPPAPSQSSPAASSPPAPTPYNPNSLSPEQLSNVLSALQVPPSPSTPPTPPVGATPQSSATQSPPQSPPGPPSSPASPVIPGPSPTQPPPPNSPGSVSSPVPPVVPGSSPSQPPPSNPPGPVSSPVPQVISGSSPPPPPPPTSLQTSPSPAIIASVQSSESAITTAEPAPTTSIAVFKGGARRRKGKPLWSLWSVSLGCFILMIF